MDSTARPSIEALLAHAGWVRSLARRLAGDPDAAEDLVQDTYLAALTNPPERSHGIATWLATTLNNVRRTQQRRQSARVRIEELGARPERVVSTDELAEQADLQRALVEHVLALEEPHRSTLLLRYFAELDPSEIAAREKLPLSTVTSRLTRAHARLRERLDREHGDRRAWLSALAPLLQRPEPITAIAAGSAGSLASFGSLIMNAKIVVSAAALALIALFAALALRGANSEVSSGSTPVADAGVPQSLASPAGGGSESPAATLPLEERRAPLGPPDAKPVSEALAPQPQAAMRVRGRLLGADGLPVAGLAVGWNGAHEDSVLTSNTGVFEIETRADSGELEVADESWITVRSGSWRAGSALEPVVIAARSLDLAGTVLDESGHTLAGARVALIMPAGFDARFDKSLESTNRRAWRALSDASGGFELLRAPEVDGARLGTVLEGYAATEIDAPSTSDGGIVIVLARPRIPLAGALQGRVVDDRGLAVPDARVFLGLASTTTDGEGRFGIPLARAVSSDRITAIKSGFLPATLDRPKDPREGDSGWPAWGELRLPGAALAISGVVVDPRDQPLAGVRVWIADPTPVGAIGKMPTFAENLMVGAPVPPMALESEARAPSDDGDNFNDFYMPVLPSNAFWHWVLTDGDGRFELGGLDDRRYRLRVMDPKSLFAATTDEIRAGSNAVRVPMPAAELIAKLAGQVLDDEGDPVAGVRVRLSGEAVGVRSRVFGGTVYVSVRAPRETSVSDADGRFEFTDVPRAGMQLTLSSEHIVPMETDIASLKDPGACKFEVHTRCSLEVLVSSKDIRADSVAVRDGDGRLLDIMVIDQGGVNAFTDVPLVDGRSGVVSTSSAARSVVLLQGGAVVRTSPIRLRSDGPNLIEL